MRGSCVAAAAIVLAVLAVPRSASAQFFLSPFVDTTLSSPSASGGHSKAGFGVSFGRLGPVIGAETEIAYHPEVLDNSANGLAKNHVLIFSEDLMIGPEIGAVRPYVAAGGGVLLLHVTSLGSLTTPSPDSVSNNYFAFNVGGGVAYSVTGHVGVRGDLRYYRASGFNFSDLESSGTLEFTRFDFWRASVGAQFTF